MLRIRRAVVIAVVAVSVLVLGWWGVIGSARVRPVPPAHADEGQEPQLREAYLQALVRRRPAHVHARMALAAALMGRGDPRLAAEQLVEAGKSAPSNAEVFAALALSAQEARWLEPELHAWQQVARLDPHSAAARVELCRLYRRLGYLSLAHRMAAEALRLTPDNPEALRAAAILEFQNQDYSAALRHARKLVAVDARSAVGHSIISRCLHETGDWQSAVASAEAAVNAAPESGDFRGELARLFLDRTGAPDYDRALAALEAPPLPRADQEKVRRYWIGVIYQRMGRAAESAQVLAPIAAADPAFEEVSFYLSRAYQQLGDTPRTAEFTRQYQQLLNRRLALQNAEAALRRNVRSPELHLRVGRAALAVGDRDRAMLEAGITARMSPGNPGARQLMAEAENPS